MIEQLPHLPTNKAQILKPKPHHQATHVVMLGDMAAGKTSLCRAANDDRLGVPHQVFFGESVAKHVVRVGNRVFNVTEIRDGEDQQQRRLCNPKDYPQSSKVDVVWLVWDANSHAGLRRLQQHRSHFERVTNCTQYLYMLIGTKCSAKHPKINRRVLQQYLERWRLPFIETDVLKNFNTLTPWLCTAHSLARLQRMTYLLKTHRLWDARRILEEEPKQEAAQEIRFPEPISHDSLALADFRKVSLKEGVWDYLPDQEEMEADSYPDPQAMEFYGFEEEEDAEF